MADKSLELVGKFIGPDEIESIETFDHKTPQGNDIIKVTCKGNKSYVYPAKTLPYVISEEASDYTTVQQKKFEPIIREVLAVMFEYDVKLGEFESLMRSIGSRVDDHISRANSYLWTKDDKMFTPGFDPMYDVTFLLADKIIKDIPKNE